MPAERDLFWIRRVKTWFGKILSSWRGIILIDRLSVWSLKREMITWLLMTRDTWFLKFLRNRLLLMMVCIFSASLYWIRQVITTALIMISSATWLRWVQIQGGLVKHNCELGNFLETTAFVIWLCSRACESSLALSLTLKVIEWRSLGHLWWVSILRRPSSSSFRLRIVSLLITKSLF